ncbi:MAG TPA: hypothetical protein PLL69_08755 [Gemmatimonadales bacterium]|nr:hypothetical protein [Gemmatimonadales bacterium]
MLPLQGMAAQGPARPDYGFRSGMAVSQHDSLAIRHIVESPTHWRTGLIVGAVAGAGLGLVAMGAADHTPSASSVVLAMGIGALVGMVPGALIGGLFPKGPRQENSVEMRVR